VWLLSNGIGTKKKERNRATTREDPDKVDNAAAAEVGLSGKRRRRGEEGEERGLEKKIEIKVAGGSGRTVYIFFE